MQLFSTPQVGDRLIYKGDTLYVYLLYLPNEFYKYDTVTIDNSEYINRIFSVNLFDEKNCWNTACGKGYRAEWAVIDDILYLTGIYSCCYYRDSIKADLVTLFKEKVINGKVKADWITEKLFSPQGKRIYYEHWGYGGINEYELEFYFEKGKLTGTHLYDNTKSRQSIYSQDPEKLYEFIYSNINWKILPKQDTVVEVEFIFSANENGLVDEVEILKGYNEIYDQEAVRVIKLIPEWDVYFSKGKHTRISLINDIIFSDENRLKYEK